MSKAPPYSKRTAHHPGRDARVLIGHPGWTLARRWTENQSWPAAVVGVLPDGDPPEVFDWSAFSGREVMVSYWRPEDRRTAAAVAVAIVRAGAALALTVDHAGDDPMKSYRPAPAMEVAA